MDTTENTPALDSLRVAFRAMGTEIALAVWPWPDHETAADEALWREVTFLRDAEALLSRFQPDSEISRLNRGAGPLRVSPLTFEAIQVALAAAAASGGLFDPTVYRALLAAGYDRSFSELGGSANRRPSRSALPWQAARWQEIRLDAAEQTVALPAGVGLDLGGIAKGWLADGVAERLGAHGPALIDLGGDIAVHGLPPDADRWAIDVDGPAGALLGTLRVAGPSGVATSGITRRRWQMGVGIGHHLIDPRTGAPALTDLLSVTVVAPTAAAAEVAAKGVLLLGSTLGHAALMLAPDLAGVLVRQDGGLLTAGNLDWSPVAATTAEVHA
ncbi:MAG TPA: FAD:protein FMN transferase [Dehalococcoidia bacterium]|jgi:thiamine biosynthesis lipoprotein